jgi:hypothetical protein
MAKGIHQPKPKLAGLNEIDLPTSETGNVPTPYFAGVRKLNVSWICQPLITKVKASNQGGK